MANRPNNPPEDSGKRQAILDQAIQVFADHGFQGTDVQVIANRAGVGKDTVYRYFHNKEDLFWAATMEVMVRLERQLFQAAEQGDTACEKIRKLAAAYAGFFTDNPQCLEVFVQGRAEFRNTGPESHREYHKELSRRFEAILQQGIDADELLPLDTEQTTHAIGGILYGTIVLGCHLSSLPASQMIEHVINIFLRGICKNAPPMRNRSSLSGSPPV